jgi:exodeoxyribonuclease V alpha subunit
LSDVCRSGQYGVAVRRPARSRIIINAHRTNEGQMPEVPAKGRESDFFFIERDGPDQIAATRVSG